MEVVRNKSRDIMILIIIIMVGIMLRFPIDNVSSINTHLLNDPDSFLFARRANEFVNKPISEWSMFTYRSDDPLMNTIDKSSDPFTTNLLPALAAIFGKIFSSCSIEQIVYFFSIFICPLAAIPVFVFVRKHSNTFGAIISALLIVVAPSYFAHTMVGFFDTDCVNIVFATVMILSHIESLAAKTKKKQILFSALTLLTLIVFSGAWEAYYAYALIAILITVVVFVTAKVNKYDINCFWPCISTSLMAVFCVLTSGEAAMGSLGRTIYKLLNGSEWPDESKFVGELAKPKFINGGLNDSFLVFPTGIVNWLGGMAVTILLFASFTVVFLSLFKSRFKNNLNCICFDNKVIAISLVVWTVTIIPALPFGIRFVQLFVLPLIVMLGLVSGRLYDFLCSRELNETVKNYVVIVLSIFLCCSLVQISIVVAIIVTGLFLLLGLLSNYLSSQTYFVLLLLIAIICPMSNEIRGMQNNRAYIDEDLQSAMKYINENASPSATIVSWWDEGYYFQYETNRHTIADGGIYDGAYFYWLANVFTGDERLSSGICRMLQSGSISAVGIINNDVKSASKTSDILKRVLMSNPSVAKNILQNETSLNENEIELVLSCTKNCNDDIYLILYDDLLEFSRSIVYYGLWNFGESKEKEVSYDAKNKTYKFPKEMYGSILEKYTNKDAFEEYEVVYKNDTATVLLLKDY